MYRRSYIYANNDTLDQFAYLHIQLPVVAGRVPFCGGNNYINYTSDEIVKTTKKPSISEYLYA